MKNKISVSICLTWMILAAAMPSAFAQRDNLSNRAMQNLTARYNILFNAKELVKESEQNIQAAYTYNYNRLLPVFAEPDLKTGEAEAKRLDAAIAKANKLANEKSLSVYVAEAYLLIGIANHLKADFFNSVEFFNYVSNSYPDEKDIRQAALVWKGRSLMQLKRYDEAEACLDTAMKHQKDSKKMLAELYACRAQLYIEGKQYPEAATLLGRAIKIESNKQQRLRWIYLAGQLEQLNGKIASAHQYYTAIVKSNAPFEMAFNANLNCISIEEQKVGTHTDRDKRLRDLLRDEKNVDFTDQIYFQLGKNFESKNQLDKAILNYNIAVRKSTRNLDQRGLSYWTLADIYFKQADYVKAKSYYDSTLAALPPLHPNYELIRKKSSNLDLLTKNLIIIAEEDTLQMLSRLSEADRNAKIEQLLAGQFKQDKTDQAKPADFGSYTPNEPAKNSANSRFYFSNSAALSQGFSDFKKRWGNRKLEDDWRRSQKSATGNIDLTQANTNVINTANSQAGSSSKTDAKAALKNSYLSKMPKTADELAASDLKIANAYFEVGNYYREVLNDNKEAIATFETLLKRFPNYVNRAAVFYNLYRLYADENPAQSDFYKNEILNKHPYSVFAKTILDPEFSRKQDEQDLALTRAYNQMFDEFAQWNYAGALACIKEMEAQFGKNRLSVQLDYLKAVSAGHQESNLAQFETALNAIASKYPEDKLITPLVKQHLSFIEENRKDLAIRYPVLSGHWSNKLLWEYEIKDAEAVQVKQVTQTDSVFTPPVNSPVAAQPTNALFDLQDTNHYYVVVNVSNPRVNLNSSRFGIGQFNRANFREGAIKHQLKNVNNENQLIFIGEFRSRETAADYEQNIRPLMTDIMKIPADQYTLFIITASNFNKLNNRETITKYLEFYQQNYQ